MELHGERGSIVLDGNDISFWKLTDSGEEEEELERLRAGAAGSGGRRRAERRATVERRLRSAWRSTCCGHQRQIEDFVAAIREGRAPAVDGPESLKALEIVLAVYRSAELGRPVELPLAEGKAAARCWPRRTTRPDRRRKSGSRLLFGGRMPPVIGGRRPHPYPLPDGGPHPTLSRSRERSRTIGGFRGGGRDNR